MGGDGHKVRDVIGVLVGHVKVIRGSRGRTEAHGGWNCLRSIFSKPRDIDSKESMHQE